MTTEEHEARSGGNEPPPPQQPDPNDEPGEPEQWVTAAVQAVKKAGGEDVVAVVEAPVFTGDSITSATAVLGLGGAAIIVLAAWVAGLFQDNVTYTTTSTVGGVTTSTQTVESLFLVRPATFASFVLLVMGWLVIVVAVGLAMADATRKVVAAGRTPDMVGRRSAAESIAPTGIAAVLAVVGQLFTSIAGALKDLKSSTAAFVIGAAMMVFGGAIAWQTVPGTDRNPTIVTPATTASSSPATTVAAATTTTAAAG